MNNNKVLYFPSFSVGAFMTGVNKGVKVGGKIIPEFWKEDFKPKNLRYPYFLVTAGHFYKKENYREEYNLQDALVMGDSGGFQIATGALKYSDELVHKIFTWLEDNSDIALNLDIPPRGVYENQDVECLELSKKNFKYFSENQSGKTKFLNVIQGVNYETYDKWYQEVKGYDFSGWSLGGAGGIVSRILDFFALLLQNKEHLKKEVKYIHILGDSSIQSFLLCSKIQDFFNKNDIDVTITLDSSSPNIQSRFGTYTTGYDIKNMSFGNIHMKNYNEKKREKDGVVDPMAGTGTPLPICCDYDRYLTKLMTLERMRDFDAESYVAFVQHNMYVLLEALRDCDYWVKSDPYFLPDVLGKDMVRLLEITEQMLGDENPYKIIKKHRLFINSFDTRNQTNGIVKTVQSTKFFK